MVRVAIPQIFHSPITTDQSWESEMFEFFSAIKSNRSVKIGNSSDALKLMKLIDKIYSFRKKEK